jgi:hypothetical protein
MTSILITLIVMTLIRKKSIIKTLSVMTFIRITSNTIKYSRIVPNRFTHL